MYRNRKWEFLSVKAILFQNNAGFQPQNEVIFILQIWLKLVSSNITNIYSSYLGASLFDYDLWQFYEFCSVWILMLCTFCKKVVHKRISYKILFTLYTTSVCLRPAFFIRSRHCHFVTIGNTHTRSTSHYSLFCWREYFLMTDFDFELFHVYRRKK